MSTDTPSLYSIPPSMGRLEAILTFTYEKIWDDGGTGAKPYDGTFFRPVPPPNFHILGDLVERGKLGSPFSKALVVSEGPANVTAPPLLPLLLPPVDFQLLWENSSIRQRSRQGVISIWQPVPAPGYVALGSIVQKGLIKPQPSIMRCVHESCIVPGTLASPLPQQSFPGMNDTSFVWADRKTTCKAGNVSCWKIFPSSGGVSSGSFVAVRGYEKPNFPVGCLHQSFFIDVPHVPVTMLEFPTPATNAVSSPLQLQEPARRSMPMSPTAPPQVMPQYYPGSYSENYAGYVTVQPTAPSATVVYRHVSPADSSPPPCCAGAHSKEAPHELGQGNRIILKFLANGNNVKRTKSGKVLATGGRGLRAQWDVERQGNLVLFRNVASPNQYLQFPCCESVDACGSGNRNCLFRPIKHKNGIYSFENAAFSGCHLGFRPDARAKKPCNTGTGHHAKFKVQVVCASSC